KTGIEVRDIAAHAVADDAHRDLGRNQVQQRIEVAEIVRKAVTFLRPFTASESAPVGRDERPVFFQSIGDELKCFARIQPSMQQKYGRWHRGGRGAPAGKGHREPPNPQPLVPRLPQRLVRRYAVQSVQMLQAATDECAYQPADRTADGAANSGGFSQLILRRTLSAVVRLDPARP